jgi:hypothetical protein
MKIENMDKLRIFFLLATHLLVLGVSAQTGNASADSGRRLVDTALRLAKKRSITVIRWIGQK